MVNKMKGFFDIFDTKKECLLEGKRLLEKIDDALKKHLPADSTVYRSNYEANKLNSEPIKFNLSKAIFKIIDARQSLEQFKKRVQEYISSFSIKRSFSGIKKTNIPRKPTGKRLALEDVIYYNEFKPRKKGIIENKNSYIKKNYHDGEYFSDGNYAIRTEKPKDIQISDETPDIKAIIPNDTEVESAVLLGELHDGFTYNLPVVHVVSISGKDSFFNAIYIDSILTKYPRAKAFANLKETGPLLFKDGEMPVGVVMPLRDAEDILSPFADRIEEVKKQKETTKDYL